MNFITLILVFFSFINFQGSELLVNKQGLDFGHYSLSKAWNKVWHITDNQ